MHPFQCVLGCLCMIGMKMLFSKQNMHVHGTFEWYLKCTTGPMSGRLTILDVSSCLFYVCQVAQEFLFCTFLESNAMDCH